jgi:transcription initiation factor TFIIB
MEENEEVPVAVVDDKQSDVAVGKCPECGSTNIIRDYDTKELVCGNCGYVLGTEMAKGPEWRSYTKEERQQRERTGPPRKPSSSLDLSTKIQAGPYTSGKRLTTEALYEIRRLSRIQRQVTKKGTEGNIEFALDQIQKTADHLGIQPNSQLRDDIATVYRRARKEKSLRGVRIIIVVVASFYYVFREKKIARTLKEIEQVTGVKNKYIKKCYRLMLKEFRTTMPIDDPLLFISKIAEKIGISGKTQGRAIEIIQEAKNKRVPIGRDPKGMAAAALYIACQQNHEEVLKGTVRRPVTVAELAEAAEVSEPTVRSRKNELK